MGVAQFWSKTKILQQKNILSTFLSIRLVVMCSEEEVHLHKSFEGAVDIVSTKINKGMSNDDMKELYALFKQATEGDVNTIRPGMFDFRGTVKWEAWLGELQNGDLDMSDTNDCLELVGGVT